MVGVGTLKVGLHIISINVLHLSGVYVYSVCLVCFMVHLKVLHLWVVLWFLHIIKHPQLEMTSFFYFFLCEFKNCFDISINEAYHKQIKSTIEEIPNVVWLYVSEFRSKCLSFFLIKNQIPFCDSLVTLLVFLDWGHNILNKINYIWLDSVILHNRNLIVQSDLENFCHSRKLHSSDGSCSCSAAAATIKTSLTDWLFFFWSQGTKSDPQERSGNYIQSDGHFTHLSQHRWTHHKRLQREGKSETIPPLWPSSFPPVFFSSTIKT